MMTASAAEVPGYPADLEQSAVLNDGRTVFVRPVLPQDLTELRQAIAEADFETLHARFLGAPPHDERTLRRLVEVDYESRLALVAFAPDGTGVGVARYEGTVGDSTAEIAVVVHPQWRKVGLGALLLRLMGEAAVRRGITRFTALLQAENMPAVSVLKASRLPFVLHIEHATSSVVIDLPTPPSGEPVPGPTAAAPLA